MRFNQQLHQKVRYQGQLYVIIFEEFPEYRRADPDFPVVLHPVGNDWIVHITNPTVRTHMTIRKGEAREVPHHTME